MRPLYSSSTLDAQNVKYLQVRTVMELAGPQSVVKPTVSTIPVDYDASV